MTANPDSTEPTQLAEALQFLFGNKPPTGLIRDLQIRPAVPSHRNPISDQAFVLPSDRFGGRGDVPVLPLLRTVVDASLTAFSSFFPDLREEAGRTPISPHGSMTFSARRWGIVDWDYVRDIDIRIYLPRQVGHESGFMSYLQNWLDRELRARGLSPLLRGVDPEGRPQVQLRDQVSGAVHGFHLFLLSMVPGFVLGGLHESGGYSVHHVYFPEDSMDAYLDESDVQWSGLIRRQREQYEEMFQRVSFNTFGGNDPASQRLKTIGWYSRKAFKWYAALANVRGLEDLEGELLEQYWSFDGSHEELAHLIRFHYYGLLDPAASEPGRMERELSYALSLSYARGRSPAGDWVSGRPLPDGREKVLVLEPAPADWLKDAMTLLETSMDIAAGPQSDWTSIRHLSGTGHVRFADGLAAPGMFRLPDGERCLLVPSVWAFLFTDAYVRRATRAARESGRALGEEAIRWALLTLLAGQLAGARSVHKTEGQPFRA